MPRKPPLDPAAAKRARAVVQAADCEEFQPEYAQTQLDHSGLHWDTLKTIVRGLRIISPLERMTQRCTCQLFAHEVKRHNGWLYRAATTSAIGIPRLIADAPDQRARAFLRSKLKQLHDMVETEYKLVASNERAARLAAAMSYDGDDAICCAYKDCVHTVDPSSEHLCHCDGCDDYYCNRHDFVSCDDCNHSLCEDCNDNEPIKSCNCCENGFCDSCITNCDECDEDCCEDCMASVDLDRHGWHQRTACKICLGLN